MRTKEPEKEATILNAAVRVIARRGFHKATISMIAERAGVATGTVYLYFKSKDDILLTIFDNVWKKVYNDLKAVVENKELLPIGKFDALIDILFDMFSDSRSLSLVIIEEQNHIERSHPEAFTVYYEKFLKLGEKIVSDGIFHKTFDPGMDTQFLRIFMFGGLRNLIDYWAHHPNGMPISTIRRNVKSISMGGILSPSVRQ